MKLMFIMIKIGVPAVMRYAFLAVRVILPAVAMS